MKLSTSPKTSTRFFDSKNETPIQMDRKESQTESKISPKELLKKSYLKQAELTSKNFSQTSLPLHPVQFSIEYKSEKTRQGEDEKASRFKLLSGDSKSVPQDSWSSAQWSQFNSTTAPLLNLSEIFNVETSSSPQKPINRIFILNPLGSGQTALSQYIASQWVTEQLWPERYEYVFWIRLEDLYDQEKIDVTSCAASPCPLAAMIHCLCLDEDRRKEVGIKTIDNWLNVQPRRTLLLLDGHDKIAVDKNIDSRIDTRHLQILLTAALSADCDLILTTHDDASLSEEVTFDRYLLNRGFSKTQAETYLKHHFLEVLKDEKISTDHSIMPKNVLVQQYMQSPRILSLFCDIYLNIKSTHRKRFLQNLDLLGLCDSFTNLLLRRYLDWQNQKIKDTSLAWDQTSEWSLNDLLATCAVEIDFLQTLAFMGINQGVCHFNATLKEQTFAEIVKKNNKNSRSIFIQALKLGFLCELPSTEPSAFGKPHKFLHPMLQEYFAARHIAERLQRHEASAYEWLRVNKYNPSYQPILNFICCLIPVQKNRLFWQVLLQEQSDLSGIGHLQLIMFRLEAGYCDKNIPDFSTHLATVTRFIMTSLSSGQFSKAIWLHNGIRNCPLLMQQLGDPFLNDLLELVIHKESTIRQEVSVLLKILATQTGLQEKLHTSLFDMLPKLIDNPTIQVSILQALIESSKQTIVSTQSLEVLFDIAKSKDWSVRRAIDEVLKSCFYNAERFVLNKRIELFAVVLKATKNELNYVRLAAITALEVCAQQVKFFPDILDILFQIAANKEVTYEVAYALAFYYAQLKNFAADERAAILSRLFKIIQSDYDPHFLGGVQLLALCVRQTHWFTLDQYAQIIPIFLKMCKNPSLYAIPKGLEFCLIQVAQSTEKCYKLLPILSQTLDDYNQGTCHEAAKALSSFAIYAHTFSTTEQTQFLLCLFKAIGNEYKNVMDTGSSALQCYIDKCSNTLPSKEEKYSADIGVNLLELLIQSLNNSSLKIKKGAVEFLKMCVTQKKIFSNEDYSKLLSILITTVRTSPDSALRYSALSSLKIFLTQLSPGSAEYDPSVLVTLLFQLLKDKDSNVHKAAQETLTSYISQATQLSEYERSELLGTLLKEVPGDKSIKFVQAAHDLLKVYVQLAHQFPEEERLELIEILKSAVAGNYGDIREIATEALKLTSQWDKSIALDEKTIITETIEENYSGKLTPLFRIISEPGETETRKTACKNLQPYAQQWQQIPESLRAELLETLFKATKDKDSYVCWESVLTLTVYISRQISQFPLEMRTKLLDVLVQSLEGYGWGVVTSVHKALQEFFYYINYTLPLPEELMLKLLNKICQRTVSSDSSIRNSAIETLRRITDYITSKSSKEERIKKIPLFLKIQNNPEKAINKICQNILMIALKGCVADSSNFLPDKYPDLLKIVFTVASDEESPERATALDILNMSRLTRSHYLTVSYENSYGALKALLQKNQFLIATPLEELITAYVMDQLLLRRDVWLQFITARAINSGISVNVTGDQLVLCNYQRQFLTITLPEVSKKRLVQKMTDTFTRNAKKLFLPVIINKPPIQLPPEEKPHSALLIGKGDESLLASKLVELEKMREQDFKTVEEVKKHVHKHESELKKHDLRLNAHDEFFKQIDATLSRLNIQVEQHNTAFSECKLAIDESKKTIHAMGTEVSGLIQKAEEKIIVAQQNLATQQQQLDQLELKISAVKPGEDSMSIQTQKDKLLQEYNQNEQALLKQYTQLTDALKDRLTTLEKHEAKEAAKIAQKCQTLQQRQIGLETSLQIIEKELQQLKETEAYNVAELSILQKQQDKLTQAYQETQQRLLERDTLLKSPKLAKFYRILYTKLSGFFLVCTVAATGLIKIESITSLKEKIAQTVVGILGDNIPIPGAKAAAGFINAMLSWHSENRSQTGREQALSASPISFTDKEIVIEFAIQEIIHRYAEQIMALTEAGVELLAVCALNRISHGVQHSDFEEQKSTTDFPIRIANCLHQVVLKQGMIGHKDLETENGIVPKGKSKWNEDGLFRRTGIRSGDGDFYYSSKTSHRFLSDKPICRYTKYGFRTIRDAKVAVLEAKYQGFDHQEKTEPTDSFQFPIRVEGAPLAAPKGKDAFFKQVKDSALAVSKQKLSDITQQLGAQIASDPTAALTSTLNTFNQVLGS
jgi:hypothetical protein